MEADDGSNSLLPALCNQNGIGLVVHAGPQRRKHIKRLKRGSGRLVSRVEAAVSEARTKFGISPEREIVPVVLLYHCMEVSRIVSVSEA